nr:hypothetical protein Iba_chr12eCG8320 [Ipomoea batatas]
MLPQRKGDPLLRPSAANTAWLPPCRSVCNGGKGKALPDRRSPLLPSRSEAPETEEKAAARRPAAPTRRRKNRRKEARTGVALPASFAVVAAVTYRPARNMGRQKEIAKKRRFEEGSSSRAPTCNDDQAPEEDDSLLGTRVLCALNPEQLALVDHYKMRKLIGRKCLVGEDTPTLRSHTLNIKKEADNNKPSISFILFNKKYTYSVDELPLVLRLYTRDEMGNLAFCSYRSNFYTDREVSNYWKNITGNCAYHSSNLHANEIKANHLKAIRIALAINLSGRTTNLNKAYRQDLFYMWNMERNELVNMGVQVKKWLAAQFKENVQTVFVGH